MRVTIRAKLLGLSAVLLAFIAVIGGLAVLTLGSASDAVGAVAGGRAAQGAADAALSQISTGRLVILVTLLIAVAVGIVAALVISRQIGERSGAALDEIAESVTATRAAIARITAAVDRMNAASAGVAEAMDGIAVMAAATSTSATSMALNTVGAIGSLESIAAVAEESSAASEEIAATAEEISAQSEGLVGASQVIAQAAATLEAFVGRFQTPDAARSATPDLDAVRQRLSRVA